MSFFKIFNLMLFKWHIMIAYFMIWIFVFHWYDSRIQYLLLHRFTKNRYIIFRFLLDKRIRYIFCAHIRQGAVVRLQCRCWPVILTSINLWVWQIVLYGIIGEIVRAQKAHVSWKERLVYDICIDLLAAMKDIFFIRYLKFCK